MDVRRYLLVLDMDLLAVDERCELGPTKFRSEKHKEEAKLPPAVLADAEGIAAGKEFTTSEAVELALDRWPRSKPEHRYSSPKLPPGPIRPITSSQPQSRKTTT